MVVLTEADSGVVGEETTHLLASLPCIVIAIDRPPADAPMLADVVVEAGVASLEDLLESIEDNPVAATSLVLCLRQTSASLGQALIAESATYSMLQAGGEFARWRRSHPVRHRTNADNSAVMIERAGACLRLTLNRPQVRNALSREMRDGLLDGLLLALADPSMTEVVLTGAGSNFSSGGDLDEFGTFSDPGAAHVIRLMTSVGRAIAALGPRIRVEVHGPCAGSGVELPAFAGHVDARADFSACLPEVSMGLIPGAGGTASITRRIGRHRMALLALSGATIDAERALRWNLIDRIVGTRVISSTDQAPEGHTPSPERNS
jgi:enoyl-CoA hydratase